MKLRFHVRFCNSGGSCDVIIDYDYLTVQVQLIQLKHSQNMVFFDGIFGVSLQAFQFLEFLLWPNVKDYPEGELVAGYQTEYSGIKYGFFSLVSYLSLLVSSLFVTVLYLGGWDLSIPYISFFDFFKMNNAVGILEITMGIFITLTKAYLFLFISITIRWTLPRMRMDQLLNLGWKFLLPISLGNLLLTTSSQLVSL